MSDLLPFVVAGLVTGSLYGLAATGLVLTYKTSGIFNFAHGAIGAAVAYAFYDLRDVQHLPGPVALLIALGVLVPCLGLALAAIAGLLADASTVRRVLATVGILLLVQGVIQLRYGIVPIPFRTSLPSGTIDVVGTLVGYDQLITMGLALAALGALGLLFTRTRLGLEMRGVVDDAELLDLAGGNPTRVRAAAWIIGAGFAGVSGIMFAPTVGLDSVLLTLLVVQAFGAAAVGRFRSLNLTFVAGLGIGVVQFLLRAPDVIDAVPLVEWLPGLDNSVSFLALFLVLLGLRRGTFSETAITRAPRPSATLGTRSRVVAAGLAVVALVVLPHAFDTKGPVLIQGAVFTVIFASLYLLVEVSGQVSLCHVAFVAVGATTFSHGTMGAGLPWLVGVLLAALVAVPIGAVVALPAARLSGVFLALATLGFGVVVQQMVYTRGIMFGTLGQRSGARPDAFGLAGDPGYFYLCAGIAAAAIATVLAVRRARLGRLLDALADSPVALATHGASVNVTRVLVFCMSASIAAVGGALLVGVVGSVSTAGVSGSALIPFNSLLWLAALVCVGRHPVCSPVLASFVLVVAPAFVSDTLVEYQPILFGAVALVVALFGERASSWTAEHGPALAASRTRSPVHARNAEAARA